MNANTKSQSRPFKLDWKKIALIAIVLAAGAYQLYTENNAANQSESIATGQPGISERSSTSNPSIEQDNQAQNRNAQNRNTDQEKKQTGQSSGTNSNRNAEEPYLSPAGGKNLKSPAGLIYTGGRNEHRSDHVLRHAADIPSRDGPHGVFDANGDDVFRLVDEAYKLIKDKSRQVKKSPSDNGKTEYVVDMKRKIGYLGGRSGKAKKHPSLYKIKLILGDNRVITAYPY